MNTNPTPDALAELIARLRGWAPGITAVRKDCLEAADTIEALAADSLEAFHAKPVVGETLGDPVDWQAKIDELYGWSGSAWIAGEDDDASDSERKSQCYTFLCSLGGYLTAGRDAAALQSPPPVVYARVWNDETKTFDHPPAPPVVSGEAIALDCGNLGWCEAGTVNGVKSPCSRHDDGPPVVEEGRREALQEAVSFIARIEAAGALEYEGENFERWKAAARELAPRLRAILALTPVEGVGEDDDLRKDVAAKRRSMSWSLRDLEAETGISFSTLGRFERGERCGRRTLAHLAEWLSTPATAQGDVREALRAEIINTPETADFMAGVPTEAIHQRERWGATHDAGKSPFDWFWLIGYLAQKAADAQVRGDADKAKHHTISTAAALANWHLAISGGTDMRPGIGPGNGGDKPGSAFAMAATLKGQDNG